VPLATCEARCGKQEDDPNRQRLSVSEGSWRRGWESSHELFQHLPNLADVRQRLPIQRNSIRFQLCRDVHQLEGKRNGVFHY
jgi:hypothetical protein